MGEILEGKLPFFERGLGEILEKVSSTEEFRPQNNLDDLIRETVNGFTRGKLFLKSLVSSDELLVEFQNEFSYAKLNNEKLLAMVPDLICALDSETGEPITTDGLRYGLRIKIVAISAAPIMRSKKALDLFGPRAFGLDFDYTPLEEI